MSKTLVFLIGLGLGVGATTLFETRQYAALQAFADSTAKASAKADSQAQQYQDSLLELIAASKFRTEKRTVYVTRSDKRVDSLALVLEHAQTDAGRVIILTDQVVILRAENDTLKAQVESDKVDLFRAMAISDSLAKTVETLNATIQLTHEKISELHETPKWKKAVIGVGAIVAVAVVARSL